MSYIDGLASGLDTTSLVRQLMEAESAPKARLEQRAEAEGHRLDAYASVRSKVASVRSAANDLDSSSTWRTLTAESSDPDAVSVSAGTGEPGGELSFTVERLASSMSTTSADTFTGPDDDLDGRTITITDPEGNAHDFDSATTLGELVTQINDAGIGVTASTLQVSSGEHQLVLSADETGAANAFAVSESGWTDAFTVTRDAADAELDVGGVTVTRSTNTIDDLIEGATVTLHDETTSEVTVGVERDVVGIRERISSLVEAVNGALGEIDTLTDYDSENDERSVLTGD
ncbi:MAG: flagellar filament capping protein FliD, partial [Acidimicrobiales bacterium]